MSTGKNRRILPRLFYGSAHIISRLYENLSDVIKAACV
jgi:hypothetical protein